MAERVAAYATIGDAVDAATSLCDVMDAVVHDAENAEDGARAFALVRSAAHDAGAVAAATAMMRLPRDSPRAGGAARRVETRAQCAGAAMLARVCLDNPEALLEFRIEDGFAVVEAMLARADPAPTPRAEADAAAVVADAVRDSGRAARRAIAAGLIPRVRKRFHAASLACYESPSALARLEGDRDERDRAVALAAALAAMQSRQREHQRDANTTRFDVAEFYVDVARVMPPNVDRHSVHVGAAAAALAAMVRSFPETAVDAEEAMRRAAVIPALTGMTLGTAGHKSHATLAEAFGAEAMQRMENDTSGAIHRGPSCRLSRRPCPPPEGEKRRRRGFQDARIERRRVGVEDEVEGERGVGRRRRRRGVGRDASARGVQDGEGDGGHADHLPARAEGEAKAIPQETQVEHPFHGQLGMVPGDVRVVFGGYVIIVYGVLIYRYLGPGEESRYITTWGIGFVINNFGLESLKIIGRKAFFILIITKGKKTFMKAAEALGWYEVYTEMVGMHLLSETGVYDSSEFRDEHDHDDGGAEDDDDGGDDGD